MSINAFNPKNVFVWRSNKIPKKKELTGPINFGGHPSMVKLCDPNYKVPDHLLMRQKIDRGRIWKSRQRDLHDYLCTIVCDCATRQSSMAVRICTHESTCRWRLLTSQQNWRKSRLNLTSQSKMSHHAQRIGATTGDSTPWHRSNGPLTTSHTNMWRMAHHNA